MTPYQAFVAAVECPQCAAPAASLCRYPGKRLPANAARVHFPRIDAARLAWAEAGGDYDYVWTLVSPDASLADLVREAGGTLG